MTTQREDSLDQYFKTVQKLDKLSSILLWFSITLSVVLLYLDRYTLLQAVANISFIVVTLLYSVISNVNALYYSRRANDARVTQLISNAFGVSLDDEHTNQYYNNKLPPSTLRLGLNVFENSFFSKTITEKMLFLERIKVLFSVIIWVILMVNRSTSLELLSVIAQTMLTTTIITNYLKLEILHHGFNRFYEGCRWLFLHGAEQHPLSTSRILDLAMRYETLKASMGINLSTRIFTQINAEKTEEWQRIKNKLNLE